MQVSCSHLYPSLVLVITEYQGRTEFQFSRPVLKDFFIVVL